MLSEREERRGAEASLDCLPVETPRRRRRCLRRIGSTTTLLMSTSCLVLTARSVSGASSRRYPLASFQSYAKRRQKSPLRFASGDSVASLHARSFPWSNAPFGRGLSSSAAAMALEELDEETVADQSSLKKCSSSGFELKAPFPPTGDQPAAIAELVQHFRSAYAQKQQQPSDDSTCAILRGITGTGKTLVMSHVIADLQRPTLVLCHNKTLAAQLARELSSFLGNAELFISFYNHYRPESFKESTGTYVAKKSSINSDIDALRHRATRALLTQRHVVVVASVSCLYGLGMPAAYIDACLNLQVGEALEASDWESALSRMLYTRVSPAGDGEDAFAPGTFQLSEFVAKDGRCLQQIIIWPPQERFPWRITAQDDTVVALELGQADGFTGVDYMSLFPAKHHVMPEERQEEACLAIEDELKDRVRVLTSEGKHEEVQRLQKRVLNDLMMIRETGFCSGIENYSRHLAGRVAGAPPETLLDYMGFLQEVEKDWFLIVDESHVTLPQLKAMYGGDQARKRSLVKHGYRLPSALDNRPLQASEFWERAGQTLFVSATPGAEERGRAEVEVAPVVDMIIRPTYVCDPVIEVRSPEGQLSDLRADIARRAEKGERALVITLTKRDAEDLSSYLNDRGIPSTYLHSGLKTNERSDALRALQMGEVDCLVGVNCLREGLDLPQVSLVAVLNADSEGFLRSETALLQIVGRAARNRNGRATFYANRVTDSMKLCIDATSERRQLQLDYNTKNGCTIRSTKGSSVMSIFDLLKDQIDAEQALEVVGQQKPASRNRSDFFPGDDMMGEITSIPIPASRRDSIDTDHIPSSPGVYFWKDETGQILYIGKGAKLRSRVKSYLSPSAQHSQRIRVMIDKARSIDFILTPSERDALILESNLIKHHQPPFNVLLKDDEHYPYICASLGDAMPRFSIVPRPPPTGSNPRHRYFGPYTSFREINIILDAIEEKYNLREESFLSRHGSGTPEIYRALFEDALDEVIGGTQASDQLHKSRLEYEEAGLLFDSPKNKCRDIVTIAESDENGQKAVVHVVQLRDGLVAGQFSYSCDIPFGLTNEEDCSMAVQTVLERKHYPSCKEASRGGFSWFPDGVLLSHTPVDSKGLKNVIRQARFQVEPSRRSPLTIETAATRGPRREIDQRALAFAQKNAVLLAVQRDHEDQRGSAVSSQDGRATAELMTLLSLEQPPGRIECYDISHTQGESAVGSRVVFVNGKPAPHLYRKFNIKTVEGIDDYASLAEVLERRFLRSWVNGLGGQVDREDPWAIPDLVVIDGGPGQLNAAIKGMSKAMIYPSIATSDSKVPRMAIVPICSLAKDQEEVFVQGQSSPVNQFPDSPALLLLRSVRDESHRFALRAHRQRRSVLNS